MTRNGIGCIFVYEKIFELNKSKWACLFMQKVYDVTAVVTHLGSSVVSGHYISYVKKGIGWTVLDDEKVLFCYNKRLYKQQYIQHFDYMFNLNCALMKSKIQTKELGDRLYCCPFLVYFGVHLKCLHGWHGEPCPTLETVEYGNVQSWPVTSPRI